MHRYLILVGMNVTLWAGPVLSQTADHAPTKPAADAAARYDKSLQQSAPNNSTSRSPDSTQGASNGMVGDEPAADSGKSGRDNGEAGSPETKPAPAK